MSKTENYEKITAQIIAMLEEGTIPWRKPWSVAGLGATSLSTGKAYRGVNSFLLGATGMIRGYGSPYWGTYKQINERGGQIRKGEKSTTVVLWKPFEATDADGEPVTRFFMTTFNVFNAEQADWADGTMPTVPEMAEHNPIEAAEAIASGYLADGPAISFGSAMACYSPAADAIAMPPMGAFETPEGYYATLFHEMAHSTGHASRLSRDGVTEGHRFGDADYSREELVAELSAAFLCDVAGIEPDATLPNAAAYVKGWLRALMDDPKMIVEAAGKAQKAADYVQGIGVPKEEERAA
jgi:antirestriction protein ArdC